MHITNQERKAQEGDTKTVDNVPRPPPGQRHGRGGPNPQERAAQAASAGGLVGANLASGGQSLINRHLFRRLPRPSRGQVRLSGLLGGQFVSQVIGSVDIPPFIAADT